MIRRWLAVLRRIFLDRGCDWCGRPAGTLVLLAVRDGEGLRPRTRPFRLCGRCSEEFLNDPYYTPAEARGEA